MAAQSKISYSGRQPTGAGDDEAAARNYLSRKKSRRPIYRSPDFLSHHSTTGATFCNCKLSPSQIDRITQPYSHSYIAWIFGKEIRPWQLATRLNRHLHLTDHVEVSELNLGIFVLKFSERDYLTLLRVAHPWSIPNLCIHAVRWIPNFKPSEAVIHVVDAWVRLHELPVEYYDDEILRQVAESIGQALVMMDPVTKDRKKCKYARICVRINLCDPLPSTIRIGGIRQEIEYEGFDLLCPRCRRVVDLQLNCLCNSSGSSRFDPHSRRIRTFQEIGLSSNSKEPLISSEPSVAWGSRHQVLGEESQALLLDWNEWPSLSVGGSERASTSSLQPQLPGLVAETIENQKEISGVSVQTLPNLPKESAQREEVSQSYHPISISSNPEAASTIIEVPVELEQNNLIPSIALNDHPTSISSYPEAASTTTTTPELKQKNLIPSIAFHDHPMSISSYPEAASTTIEVHVELEQNNLIPSIVLNDHPMSISSCPEAASTTTTTLELEEKHLISSIAFHDHPMSISSYSEAAASITITAPELEQNSLIPSMSKNDHPMSISSSPEATLTTTTAAAELEQNNLNLSMALTPCVVKDQLRATETSHSTTLSVHDNQLQPSSPTASIVSPRPSPTSETVHTFYSNVIKRSIIEKEITNTPFEGNGISRCPVIYTIGSSITSFAVGLSENPNSVPKQNHLVINIVSSSRNEQGIGSEAVSASNSKKMLGWKFCGRDNANLIEGLKYVVKKYETSIVVIFASWISDDVVEEVVEELAFHGSYCKKFDDCNRGVWLLMFKQDMQTEVFEAPQQDSAYTETSWQTWGPASFCDSTYSMANTLAY